MMRSPNRSVCAYICMCVYVSMCLSKCFCPLHFRVPNSIWIQVSFRVSSLILFSGSEEWLASSSNSMMILRWMYPISMFHSIILDPVDIIFEWRCVLIAALSCITGKAIFWWKQHGYSFKIFGTDFRELIFLEDLEYFLSELITKNLIWL